MKIHFIKNSMCLSLKSNLLSQQKYPLLHVDATFPYVQFKDRQTKKTTAIEKNVLLYLQAVVSLGSGQVSLLNQRPEHGVVQVVYVTWEINTHTRKIDQKKHPAVRVVCDFTLTPTVRLPPAEIVPQVAVARIQDHTAVEARWKQESLLPEELLPVEDVGGGELGDHVGHQLTERKRKRRRESMTTSCKRRQQVVLCTSVGTWLSSWTEWKTSWKQSWTHRSGRRRWLCPPARTWRSGRSGSSGPRPGCHWALWTGAGPRT